MKKPLRILAAAMAPLPIIAGVLAGTGRASPQPLVAVPQNVNPAIAHSSRVGDLGEQQRLSVAVSLKLHDQAGLKDFLAKVSDKHSALYRHYLTPAEFTVKYGPSTADVAKVTDFLRANGLQIKKVAGNRQVVDATGSAAQLEKAFGTTIGTYRQGARQFYANDSAPVLPAAVAGVVQGVAGLDDHALRHTFNQKNAAVRPSASPHATAGGFEPSQLQAAYDTSSLGNAGGQSVALWEFDGYQTPNISAYDSQFGISAPTPQTVSVDGANYDSSPGQGQGEVELDIELVQAIASAANTYVYEAPNSDQGQIDLANQIATDDKVSVTSISWGQCEASSASATITSTDNALQQGAAEGISFYSASGDSGSDDCGTGTDGVDYPASDPNVSGVGGTSLTASNGYGSETAWSGSGGGTSTVFSTPSWQTGSGGMRTVPDVSSDADPNTGYAIYSAGAWNVYGGTSCAAPMWSAFTALYDATKGGKLGNPNPALYTVGNGASYGTAFHDVTSGSNGSFSAGPGYDQVTGWGSYDAAKLAGVL